MASVQLIGVDCAVAPENTGLCLCRYEDNRIYVLEGVSGADLSPAERVSGWYKEDVPLILGLDAPLGWPVSLGDSLKTHTAGESIEVDANTLFRRFTDDFTAGTIGKRPMDVGADRIARTAKAALNLLADLRDRLGCELPLGWNPGENRASAVLETYPAAWLKVNGLKFQGYKKKYQREERKEILAGLSSRIVMECSAEPFLDDADILDSLLCNLISTDYLEGNVYFVPEEKTEIVRREGWIWLTKG